MIDALKLKALQLCIFEIPWLASPWVNTVYLKSLGKTVVWVIQVQDRPSGDEQEAFERLMQEVVDAVFEDTKSCKYQYENKFIENIGFIEVMSDKCFRAIASEVAPWRMDLGR
jgi:hypothetical protein